MCAQIGAGAVKPVGDLRSAGNGFASCETKISTLYSRKVPLDTRVSRLSTYSSSSIHSNNRDQ